MGLQTQAARAVCEISKLQFSGGNFPWIVWKLTLNIFSLVMLWHIFILATSFIGHIGEFDPGKEQFENYIKRLEIWMTVSKIEAPVKNNVFLCIDWAVLIWTVSEYMCTSQTDG